MQPSIQKVAEQLELLRECQSLIERIINSDVEETIIGIKTILAESIILNANGERVEHVSLPLEELTSEELEIRYLENT